MSGKYYYIPNLDKYLEGASTRDALVVSQNRNVIELSTPTDIETIIGLIQAHDEFKDPAVKAYLDKELPELAALLKKHAVTMAAVKQGLMEVFSNLPEHLFEDDDFVEVIKKVIRFIIKKNESDFIVTNLMNSRLEFDPNYKFIKVYDSYFQTLKIGHDADFLFAIITRIHRALLKIHLKDMVFDDRPKSRKEIELISQGFNMMGQTLVNYRYLVERAVETINEDTVFLKRTNLPTPPLYGETRVEVLTSLGSIKTTLDKQITELTDIKTRMRQELLAGREANKNTIQLLWALISKFF